MTVTGKISDVPQTSAYKVPTVSWPWLACQGASSNVRNPQPKRSVEFAPMLPMLQGSQLLLYAGPEKKGQSPAHISSRTCKLMGLLWRCVCV